MSFHRFTPEEIQKALRARAREDKDAASARIASLLKERPLQIFDFGRIGDKETEHLANGHKMSLELWKKGLLRLPFPNVIYMFTTEHNRYYLIGLSDIMVDSSPARARGVKLDADDDRVSTVVICATQSRNNEEYLRLDAFIWFSIDQDAPISATGKMQIHFGVIPMTDIDGETDEQFKAYTQGMTSRLINLSLLLNTKGMPTRHEPAPVKLNAKRAKSDKPPIPAITYVDLMKVVSSSGRTGVGHGVERCMHLRRGHIRHYDDGSVTWVRDTIVKADGELKKRERYQVRSKDLV